SEGEPVLFTLLQELLCRGAGKTAALAKRVTLVTRAAPPLGIFCSVSDQNLSEILCGLLLHRGAGQNGCASQKGCAGVPCLSYTLEFFHSVGNKEDKFYNNNIHKNDVTAISGLQENLNAIGICLTDDKIQKALDNTNLNDEVVHFKDFINELTNTDEFVECQKDACNVINSVCDGKVGIKDLLSTLKSLEKPLNEEQFKVLSNHATDAWENLAAIPKRNAILKDVIDVFTNSPNPSTPFSNLLKEITTLDSIRNETMPVNELSSKLLSAGIPISNKTFQEILRQASVNETEDSLKVLASIKKNVANPDDLGFIMENVGVPLPQDVIQRTLNNVAFSGDLNTREHAHCRSSLPLPRQPTITERLSKQATLPSWNSKHWTEGDAVPFTLHQELLH
ncbi:hypothetical protein P7K49_010673, partial [Saguinus oedipus]